MASAAQKERQELRDEIAALQADISALKTTLIETGRTRGATLRAVANDATDELAAKGAEQVEELRSAAQQAYAKTEDAVRANPGTAVGIAAAAGFLIGMIAAGRK